MKENFEDRDKIEAFNFIIDEYFSHGFGTLTKGDIEVIFFSALNKYSNITLKGDYELSKLLKITQARVRNLKIKDGLKFRPTSREHVLQAFIKNAQYARIEEDKKRISFPINEPTIFIELEHLIEQSNGYVDFQLNPKIFTIRIDQFVNLFISFDSIHSGRDSKFFENSYFDNLKNTIKSEKKYSDDIDLKSIMSLNDLQKILLGKGVDFGIDLLFSFVPGSSIARPLLDALKNRFLS
ncbi:MAG: hypothetical protein WCL21_09195 [Mariniphaga sp.]